MLYVWIALTLLFLVAEAATVQIVSIWFAVGALAALLAEVLGANLYVELILFVGISLVLLFTTRPFVKKKLLKKVEPTNVDRNIGAQAVVLEEIDNIKGQGLVSVKGVHWTARSADGDVIAPQTQVIVQAIEGVKLIVKEVKPL